jgi:hypothetical protein
MKNEPSPGIYRHYKGGEYEVLMVAVNSESGEELVVYQELRGERAIWARPRTMFVSDVVVNGVAVPRFQSRQQCDSATKRSGL